MIAASPPDFLRSVLDRLRHAGHEAYLVGGAVRDTVLGRPVTDWDVATSARSDDIKRLFQDTRHFTLGHETVTLVAPPPEGGTPRHRLEVTPYRGPEGTLQGDLRRRDFTIDAMAWDAKGSRVIDPHAGLRDLRMTRVRAVDDPAARFREDPARLMRAVRIAVELGFDIENETYTTLSKFAPSLRTVAAERVRDEFLKIMVSPEPARGVTLLRRSRLLEEFLPELQEGHLKRQNAAHRHTILKHALIATEMCPPAPALRLAALLHDIAKPRVRRKIHGRWDFPDHEEAGARMAEEILLRLRFSRRMIRRVTRLMEFHTIRYRPGWSDAAVRRFLRHVGTDTIDDLLTLRRADLLAYGNHHPHLKDLVHLEQRIRTMLRSPLPAGPCDLAIDGRKVMEILGLSPGPALGAVLHTLFDRVTEDPELNTEANLIRILKTSTTAPPRG